MRKGFRERTYSPTHHHLHSSDKRVGSCTGPQWKASDFSLGLVAHRGRKVGQSAGARCSMFVDIGLFWCVLYFTGHIGKLIAYERFM